jgi:dihydrofolate reductase
VGKHGQLGLDGKLPWNDAEDLRWFQGMTKGRTLIVGPVTAAKLPPLPDRTLYIQRRHEDPRDIAHKHPDGIVIGGMTIYMVWLRSGLIRRSYITHINYDGVADRVMPSLWNDDTGAIMENVKMEEWTRSTGRRLLKTGNTHAAKLWGSIADHIKQTREAKWPFFKGFQ